MHNNYNIQICPISSQMRIRIKPWCSYYNSIIRKLVPTLGNWLYCDYTVTQLTMKYCNSKSSWFTLYRSNSFGYFVTFLQLLISHSTKGNVITVPVLLETRQDSDCLHKTLWLSCPQPNSVGLEQVLGLESCCDLDQHGRIHCIPIQT